MTQSSPPGDSGSLDPDITQLMDQQLGVARAGDAQILARVKEKVMRAIGAAPSASTVRAASGDWRRIAPGIEQKVLCDSGSGMSCLLRCAPGAALPAHVHRIDEECLVLEGTLRIGDELVLRAGDFHVAPAGSAHPLTSTDTGVLLYLRGELACGH